MSGEVDIVIVGAGAAGVGAARRLADSGRSFLVLEARSRVGGRAWTVTGQGGHPIDLGCHWLHSADRNPWVPVAEKLGFAIDRSLPPWGRQSGNLAFRPDEQVQFRDDREAFWERVHAAAEAGEDRPAADFADPASRWNPLISAGSTWANGVEPDRLSSLDHWNYDDSGVNWRMPAGYGGLVAAHAAGLPVVLDCPVSVIDHAGPQVRLETPQGTVRASAVIVTIPPTLLLAGQLRFRPELPDKLAAAAGLPLGLADKLYMALDRPELVPEEGHLYGRIDRTDTGAYHLRPFGRPYIEGYFGGAVARQLEAGGMAAFFAHAADELAGLLGNDIRGHLHPMRSTAWDRDPLALGSYSYALPGRAGARRQLAEPVDGRIHFAGEACSAHDFSTAHGAYLTGIAAAEQALAAAPVA